MDPTFPLESSGQAVYVETNHKSLNTTNFILGEIYLQKIGNNEFSCKVQHMKAWGLVPNLEFMRIYTKLAEFS